MPIYVPNLITSFRFLLVPIYIGVFYSSMEHSLLYATLIFALAGITDVLDGYIARKFDLITKLGTILDPLADKSMQLAVLITFTTKGYIPLWAIAIIGIKEVLMIIGGAILYLGKSDAVIPSDKYGKFGTVLFYITIFVISFTPIGKASMIGTGLIVLTIFVMLVAFINYLMAFVRLNREKKIN